MNKPIEGVKYIEDIIKEVAADLGREEKEVREAWKIHIGYIKSLMDKEDSFVITLPRLGNLFYNAFLQKNFNSKAKNDIYESLNKKSEKIDNAIIEHSKEKRKTVYTYPQGKRSTLYNLYRSVQWNFLNKVKSYSSFEKVILLIEEYSKKLYKGE